MSGEALEVAHERGSPVGKVVGDPCVGDSVLKDIFSKITSLVEVAQSSW